MPGEGRWRRNLGRHLTAVVRSDAAVDMAATGIGASLSVAFTAAGNPAGAILATMAAATAADVAKNLTKREEVRLRRVTEVTAAEILRHVAEGAAPRNDIDHEKAAELLEGVLQTARRSYEEKKVPLLANLLGAAPFTGTPMENLIAPLELIERLTYRQLCLLALIPGYVPNDYAPLTDATVGELYAANPVGEFAEGVLADLTDLIRQGLVVQAVNGVVQEVANGQVRPRLLLLGYPARLLSNGAMLRQTIPDSDVAQLRELLSHPTPGERVRHPPIPTQ